MRYKEVTLQTDMSILEVKFLIELISISDSCFCVDNRHFGGRNCTDLCMSLNPFYKTIQGPNFNVEIK